MPITWKPLPATPHRGKQQNCEICSVKQELLVCDRQAMLSAHQTPNSASDIKFNEPAPELRARVARSNGGAWAPWISGCASAQSPAASRIECHCTVVEFACSAGRAGEGRVAMAARRSRSAGGYDAGGLALFHALRSGDGRSL